MNQSPPNRSDPSRDAGDDARIGRAFRWSWLAWSALALCAGGMVWWLNRRPTRPPGEATPLSAPAAPAKSLAEIPDARFTDVTAASGIRFLHHNGAYGDKLLPETMSGGVAFFDFDGDGDQDLLFIDSTSWPWRTSTQEPPTLALYRNDGQGHFEDVTAGSGLEV